MNDNENKIDEDEDAYDLSKMPKMKPTVTHIKDAVLSENMQTLFKSSKLLGDCDLYALYQKIESDDRYGLVYATYYHKDGFRKETFIDSFKDDAKTLHDALVASKLAIDYYFIMPYFHDEDNQCYLYNEDIIITNTLNKL